MTRITGVRVVLAIGVLIGLSAAAQDQSRVKELENAERAAEAKRERAKPAREDGATAALLNRRIFQAPFKGIALEDALDFLRDVTGANMSVHWKAIEKAGLKRTAPVTVDLKDVTFRTALTKVLESVSTDKVKLGFTADDGVVIISTAGDDPAARVVGKLPPEADRTLPEASFSGQSFSDVVDFLRDVSGTNIFVNWKELKRAGIDKDAPVTARLRDAKLSTVIRTVLSSVGDEKTPLQFIYEANVITITTAPKDAKKSGK